MSNGASPFSAATLRDRLRHPTPLPMVLKEKLIEAGLLLCGWVSILFILLIFIFLFKEGFTALRMVETKSRFLYSDVETFHYDAATDAMVSQGVERQLKWEPVSEKPHLSILPLLWGSFGIALLSALLSTVAGIAIGVFLAELAGDSLRGFVKPALELLVGIPTVVIGFFMLAIVALPVKELLNPSTGGGILSPGSTLTKWGIPAYNDTYNMLIGAIGVSIVIIPVIASLVDDALRAIPQDLRAASLSLGATRWQTTWRVVLPAATSGVLAAVILGFGRAIGETMIVLMCAGNAPQIAINPFDSVRTMTATIASEMGAAQQGSLHAHTLFLVGAVLVSLSFILNIIVESIASHYRKKVRL